MFEPDAYAASMQAVRTIRSAKSAAKVSVGTPVGSISLRIPSSAASFIDDIIGDVRNAARADATEIEADGQEWIAVCDSELPRTEIADLAVTFYAHEARSGSSA